MLVTNSTDGIKPSTRERRKVAALGRSTEDVWGMNFFLGEDTAKFTAMVSYGANVMGETSDIASMGGWIRRVFPRVKSIRSSTLVASARIREIMKYVNMDACSREGIDVRTVRPVVMWLQEENDNICLLGETSAVFVIALAVSQNEEQTEWAPVPLLMDIQQEDAYTWIERDHALLTQLKYQI